jgi:hypothetical protein
MISLPDGLPIRQLAAWRRALSLRRDGRSPSIQPFAFEILSREDDLDPRGLIAGHGLRLRLFRM